MLLLQCRNIPILATPLVHVMLDLFGRHILRKGSERLSRLPTRLVLPSIFNGCPKCVPWWNVHVLVPCNQLQFLHCWILLPHWVQLRHFSALSCGAVLWASGVVLRQLLCGALWHWKVNVIVVHSGVQPWNLLDSWPRSMLQVPGRPLHREQRPVFVHGLLPSWTLQHRFNTCNFVKLPRRLRCRVFLPDRIRLADAAGVWVQ